MKGVLNESGIPDGGRFRQIFLISPSRHCSSIINHLHNKVTVTYLTHWSCNELYYLMLRPVFRVTFSWANTSRKRSRTSAWLRKVLARYIHHHHPSYHLTPAQHSICRKVVFTALYICHGSSLACIRSVHLIVMQHFLLKGALSDSSLSLSSFPYSDLTFSVAWPVVRSFMWPLKDCHTMLF